MGGGVHPIAYGKTEVMVLDIGMPSFNGCEVPQRVRSQTQGDFPLLVVVTGWGQDDDRCKALHAVLERVHDLSC